MLQRLNEYIEDLNLWALKKPIIHTNIKTRGINFGWKVGSVQDEQNKIMLNQSD